MSLFPTETLPAHPAGAATWIHAHCDGGSRGNPGPAGYGAVVTDAQGTTLAELSQFLGVKTNNFAEYSGLLAVLEWALENGRSRVKVVSDSELMVKQIQGKYKVNSPDLKPLWQQARERIAKLEKFEISHALRHKNKEADALANQAMDRGMGRGAGSAGGDSIPLRPRPVEAVSRPMPVAAPTPPARPVQASEPTMLRGFTRNGQVHLLGGATLPDGIFVKIIRE
jgi:ribonuclease HI